MDSGQSGDSFLAPRMLPDPDDGGDYRWPPSCMITASMHTITNSQSPTPFEYAQKHLRYAQHPVP